MKRMFIAAIGLFSLLATSCIVEAPQPKNSFDDRSQDESSFEEESSSMDTHSCSSEWRESSSEPDDVSSSSEPDDESSSSETILPSSSSFEGCAIQASTGPCKDDSWLVAIYDDDGCVARYRCDEPEVECDSEYDPVCAEGEYGLEIVSNACIAEERGMELLHKEECAILKCPQDLAIDGDCISEQGDTYGAQIIYDEWGCLAEIFCPEIEPYVDPTLFTENQLFTGGGAAGNRCPLLFLE